MTSSEMLLSATIEELLANYEASKANGQDPLARAIQLLDDHIQRYENAIKLPLWVEICQAHHLSETEWGPVLANIFRTMAARCPVIEVVEWLNAEADLAEHQHE